jgi:hypothetical protein
MNQNAPLAAFQASVMSHTTPKLQPVSDFVSPEMSAYAKVQASGFPAVRAAAQEQATAGPAGGSSILPGQAALSAYRDGNPVEPISSGTNSSCPHPFMPPNPPSTGALPAATDMSPSLQNLLMAWYWCGYYAGQHDSSQATK